MSKAGPAVPGRPHEWAEEMGMTGKERVLLVIRDSVSSQLAPGTSAEDTGQPGPQPQEAQGHVEVGH